MSNFPGFKIRSSYTDVQPSWGNDWRGHSYKVTVTNPRGRNYTFPFFKGLALTAPPTVAEVLHTLASDAALYRDSDSLEDFAANVGQPLDDSQDYRVARKLYRDCEKSSVKLDSWLTEDEFEEALEADS